MEKIKLTEEQLLTIFNACAKNLWYDLDGETLGTNDIEIGDGLLADIDGLVEFSHYTTDDGLPSPYTNYYEEIDGVNVSDLQISVYKEDEETESEVAITPEMVAMCEDTIYDYKF